MTENEHRRALIAAWLCSAAVVTTLRFLNVGELGYDLTLQIQAAQNLLAGKGLSVYKHAAPDLAEPAQLFTLTHFPAGFSLFTAALIALGAGVGTVVKVLGAAATMLGWWGWARLTDAFLGPDPQRGRVWRWVGLLIAVVTPLRYTPPWAGTDIALWAAVPWVLMWLVRASDDTSPAAKWLDCATGAVCGLCLLMRYASLFLVVYAGCVMLWQSRRRVASLARRWAFFGLGFLPAFGVQFYVNYIVSNAPARPGGLGSGDGALGFMVHRASEGLPLLGAANYPWVFWLPGQMVDFFTRADGAVAWRAGIVGAVFIAIVTWVAAYGVGGRDAARDPRIVGAGLFVALPVVLWACMTLSSYDYLADQRYYWPLVPLSTLILYTYAAGTAAVKRWRMPALTYVAAYMMVGLLGIAALFGSGERGSAQRVRLIGTRSFDHWPSTKVTYDFYPSRGFVRTLLDEQPGTLFLSSKTHWFLADSTIDQSRILPLTCNGLPATWFSGPARVVILSFDHPGPAQGLWAWTGKEEPERASCFERLPGLTLVRRFPLEGVKVLESRIPSGISVGRPTGPVL